MLKKFFRVLRGKHYILKKKRENDVCNDANGQQGETVDALMTKEQFTKINLELTQRRRFEGRKLVLYLHTSTEGQIKNTSRAVNHGLSLMSAH